MPHTKPPQKSPLVEAAETFDACLRQFAALAESVRKPALDSGHDLARAAEALKAVVACEEDLQVQARTLIVALGKAREAQEAHAELVRNRALEVQARSGQYAAILGRFEAIGTEAAELNTATQNLASQRKIANETLRASDLSPLLSDLGEIEDRMTGVIDSSEELANEARGASFDDLHRRTDALRQQLMAARNRIKLLKETLVKAVPGTLLS